MLANAFINDNRPASCGSNPMAVTGDDVFAGRVPLPPQNPLSSRTTYEFRSRGRVWSAYNASSVQ